MVAGRQESVKNEGLAGRLVNILCSASTTEIFSLGKKKLPLFSNADNSKQETECCYLLKNKGNCACKTEGHFANFCTYWDCFFLFFLSFSGEGGARSWVSVGKHVSKTPLLWQQQLRERCINADNVLYTQYHLNRQSFPFSKLMVCISKNTVRKENAMV